MTHSELRAAGKKRLVRHLQAGGGLPNVDALADRALAAAAEQTLVAPAERMTARLIGELATEALSRFRSADALASAAGMAPVLRQSGRTRFLRRPNGGNKDLKRVFHQSAFCSPNHDNSRTFHDRKQREGTTAKPSSPPHDAA